MKKIKIWSLIAVLAIALLGYSCSDDDEHGLKNVKIMLSYPDGIDVREGVNVKARGTSGIEFELKTDKNGTVLFRLPIGRYEFTASDIRSKDKSFSALNGLLTQLIGNEWKENSSLILKMTGSTRSQLILKEVYFGGCPKDNSKRAYIFDSYITLYNNSSEPVDLQNLCIGSVQSNSFGMRSDIDIEKGQTAPRWFKKDYTPVSVGYFYFSKPVSLQPYETIVISAKGAIDHTKVHSQSVDLSSATNYVMYDIEKFNHRYYYPAPSANIPTSQYLPAEKFPKVPNNAWSPPISSPNLFLFYPKNRTPKDYATNNTDFDFWRKSPIHPRAKVPVAWTLDAIDAFAAGKESDNVKRIHPKVDAGHIYFVSKKGYTLYRNVDKDLTEAIEGNKDKLVYNYAMGTKQLEPKYGSTDPSGIDAEASIAKGAIIIYKDTNNSGNDFHMRQKSTLRK